MSSTSTGDVTPAADEAVTVTLDSAVVRLNAAKKAAYRLSGACFVEVRLGEGGTIQVTLRAKPGAQKPISELAGDFQNEALDQELREVVADETAAVRNVILAQAFSKTSLLDGEGESADFQGDPLGIGRPEGD